jgi:hypothetical protein
MLSAFENLGSGLRPDPERSDEAVQAGGHGGELLRGGYAQAAWRTPAPLGAARAAELLRRMTTRRLSLLRPASRRRYPGPGDNRSPGIRPRLTAVPVLFIRPNGLGSSG